MNISRLQAKTRAFLLGTTYPVNCAVKKSDFHSVTRGFLTINFSRSQPVLILHGICMCIFNFFFGNTRHNLV